jgi:hypothetical protein
LIVLRGGEILTPEEASVAHPERRDIEEIGKIGDRTDAEAVGHQREQSHFALMPDG